MIFNATLQRIDLPKPATAGGQPGWSIGKSIDHRITFGSLTFKQASMSAALEVTLSASCYVPLKSVGAWPRGCRITVKLDGQEPALYRVEKINIVNKPGGVGGHSELLLSDLVK